MTELKPYPKYKDSGVEWIGEIPESWEVSRLKASIKYVKNGIWGTDEKRDLNDIYCVRIADFDRNKARVKNIELTIRNIPKNDQKHYILKSGDLLIEKSGGGDKQPVGYTVLYDLDKKAVYSNFIAKMRLYKNKVNPYFMTYLHQSIYAHKINVKSIKQTTGIQNLDLESYFNEKVAYPPLHEQEKIVSYLNRKSFYIDSLIIEKKRLIALLEEKRQAVITETVTKGLDPNVKMKDSGIELIGKIPNHWLVVRLKHIASNKSNSFVDGPFGSNLKNNEYTMEGVPVIQLNNIRDSKLRLTGINYVSKEKAQQLSRHIAYPENLVIAKMASPLVRSAIVPNDYNKYVIVADCIKLELKEQVNNKFINYFMNTKLMESQAQILSKGTTRVRVNLGIVKNLKLSLPPLEEQNEIVEYLDKFEKNYSMTINKLKDQISKLQEYRESLIYEAVTGKIDLREYSLEKEQTDWNYMGKVAELNETYQ